MPAAVVDNQHTSGQITWDFHGQAFDFLAAGEVLKLSYAITATDDSGMSNNTGVGVVTVTLTGSNDLPTITSDASAATGTTKEDVTLTATGTLTSSDADYNATASWSVVGTGVGTYGNFAVNATTGVWTYTLANGVDGNDGAVQSLAAGDHPDENFTVRVTDDKNEFRDQTVTITVNGTDDVPFISGDFGSSAKTITEDAALDQNGFLVAQGHINIRDPDHGQASFTPQNSVAGTYGVFSITGSGDWTYTADNSQTSIQHLAANQRANDGFSVASINGVAVGLVGVDIWGANDAPVLAAATPSLTMITEDDTANAGQTVGSIVGSTVTDVDSPVHGIAITGVSSTNGGWQYSLNSGSTWSNFGAYVPNSALLLNDTDLVRFVPNGVNGGTDTFSYKAWDLTSGTHGDAIDASAGGGTTAFSTGSNTASLTVTAVNDAPSAVAINNVIASIDENTSTATHIKVADIAVTDVDGGTNTLALTGTDAASFEIVGTELYLKAGVVLDYETKASYAVAVTVDDTTVGGTPDATSTTYTLLVNNVLEARPANINLSSLNGTNGFKLSGAAVGDAAGSSVASAGDVNNDGYIDLLVGAPNVDLSGGNGTNAGASYVVFGSAAGFASNVNLSALGTGGFQILSEKGIRHRQQWFLGGRSRRPQPRRHCRSHRWLTHAVNKHCHGGNGYVVFGKSTLGANIDLNASGTVNGSNVFSLQGPSHGSQAGYSVASAGDFNHDGIGDLLIGAPSANPGGANSGAGFVVFGHSSAFPSNIDLADASLNSATGLKFSGVAASDHSGSSVAAGDINGDGFSDIIIGAPNANPSSRADAGAVYVVFGTTSTFSSGNLNLSDANLNGTVGFKISGAVAGDLAGTSVASAGDINGDGYADIVVGAPHATGDVANSGAAYVVFGKAAGGFERQLRSFVPQRRQRVQDQRRNRR